jgi:uncharacterized protein involved in exopolysaccharide biosynthesis
MNTSSSAPSPDRRQGILHRTTGRWWQILLLGMVITVPLVSVISLSVERRYEAFSLLQVRPVNWICRATAGPDQADIQSGRTYLKTQFNMITTDSVLTTALASPEIKNLSIVTEAVDARTELRDRLMVTIVPDSYLIRVALELPNGAEAAAIVNAVVNSYLAYNGEFKRGENSKLRASLSAQRVKVWNEIKIKREELKALYRRNVVSSVSPLNDSGNEGDPTRPTFSSVTEKVWESLASEIVKTDLELIKAQAALDALLAADQREGDLKYKQELAELKLNVAALVKQKQNLAKYYAQSKVDGKAGTDDSVEAKFLNRQLETLMASDNHLKTNLEELEFKASQEDYRVVQVDEATVPKVPTTDNRFKYMIAAPIAVYLMLLGLFLLIPINAESSSQRSASGPAPDESRVARGPEDSRR